LRVSPTQPQVEDDDDDDFDNVSKEMEELALSDEKDFSSPSLPSSSSHLALLKSRSAGRVPLSTVQEASGSSDEKEMSSSSVSGQSYSSVGPLKAKSLTLTTGSGATSTVGGAKRVASVNAKPMASTKPPAEIAGQKITQRKARVQLAQINSSQNHPLPQANAATTAKTKQITSMNDPNLVKLLGPYHCCKVVVRMAKSNFCLGAAEHNKKFKKKPAYEPRMYSIKEVRDVRN